MARTLEHLAAHCNGDDRPECPILNDLEDDQGLQQADSSSGVIQSALGNFGSQQP